MSLTHRGITPIVTVKEVANLQNTIPVAGTKWRRNSANKLVATTRNEGICATLTNFWLSSHLSGSPVTSVEDFPSRQELSLTQSRYELRHRIRVRVLQDGGYGANLEDTAPAYGDDGLAERFGLKVQSSATRKRKWYMWKKTRLQEIAAAMVGWPGYYHIGIYGDGGHALGAVTRGRSIQFFDANEGIMTFATATDLEKWMPSYVASDYSDLLESVELLAIGV